MSLSHLADPSNTIIALATPAGRGAISVLRLSGDQSIQIVNQVFRGKDLEKQPSHTIHFGTIREENEIVDEVLVSLFKGPKSFTGEDVIEISCHGSPYIVNRLIRLFLGLGARYAKAGEFTKRAFANGRFDLAQAEAVADLIAADSAAGHQAALNQMRGGFSKEIRLLREKLINFASLIELELDFSEEDVEFADRTLLRGLIAEIQAVILQLIQSFSLGNVIKNGVPTVIAGRPNAGKSTLLNALLNEDKAIVSEIPGTTRDFIEDELVIEGISFRFIDTAGLRETQDQIEAIGVQRTYAKMKDASLILYLFDITQTSVSEFFVQIEALKELKVPFLAIANKIDLLPNGELPLEFQQITHLVGISAGQQQHLEDLKTKLLQLVNADQFSSGNAIVTNVRHYESLTNTQKALEEVLLALDSGITGDFLAMDIRQALHHLGEITGEITTDDLLGNIFSKFCIGK
jgi:tRNA modification GTPase